MKRCSACERTPSVRRRVVRDGRRYDICGRTARMRRRVAERAPAPALLGLGWLSGATLLVAMLFSAYVIARPPAPAQEPSGVASARYSFDDFARAAR